MNESFFIEKIQKIYETPGGKQAAALIVQKLGAEPYLGDILDPSYVYKIGNRNILEGDLKIWIQETNPDLEQSAEIMKQVLLPPTKENFLLLFGEVMDTQIPFLVPINQDPVFHAKLHPETIKDFEKFVTEGLIEIITDKSDFRLKLMRPDQKIFLDNKREVGTGYLCAIQLNKSLYN